MPSVGGENEEVAAAEEGFTFACVIVQIFVFPTLGWVPKLWIKPSGISEDCSRKMELQTIHHAIT
jgi:hypothetical protein